MSIRYHRKSDHAPFICLYDHESWPCSKISEFDIICDEILSEIQKISGVGPYSAGIYAVAEQAMRNISPME